MSFLSLGLTPCPFAASSLSVTIVSIPIPTISVWAKMNFDSKR